MRKVFFILTTCALLLRASYVDALARCDVPNNPKITFYSSLGKLVYDFSMDYKGISKRANKIDSVLGLAERRLGQAIRIKLAGVPYRSGYCIVPTEIEVYVGIGAPTIFVTNDYKPEECHYKFVLRHEQAHMQVSIRMLEHFVKEAPERFRMASALVAPVFITNQSQIGDARQTLFDEYSAIVTVLREALDEAVEEEQQKIDDEKIRGLIVEVCGKHSKIY